MYSFLRKLTLDGAPKKAQFIHSNSNIQHKTEYIHMPFIHDTYLSLHDQRTPEIAYDSFIQAKALGRQKKARVKCEIKLTPFSL
jgi:hypothetical protein